VARAVAAAAIVAATAAISVEERPAKALDKAGANLDVNMVTKSKTRNKIKEIYKSKRVDLEKT